MVALIIILLIILLFLLLALGGRVQEARFKPFRGRAIAHRGLHKNPQIPENSLPAFGLAVNHGYGIELDVHLLSDGTLAVFHDNTLFRMTGLEGNIKDLTKEELKNIKLNLTENHIPTFEEVLTLVDGKVPLIIEIKTEGNTAELCSAVMKALKNYQGDYCIESFDPRVLFWLRKNHPEVTRGQLSQNFLKRKENLNIFLRLILTQLLLNFLTRPDFIAYRFSDRKNLFNTICIKFWKLQPVYWTIRNNDDLATAKSESAISIFEDFLPEE
ncbi:MAG: glycerophosphodiester phosphodiesterase family protein [Acutalibacteraceae bacterium]|nr:glycerophosphodiester phosphodiesterase family protein [Acutalibacteraceae bacterium]